MVTNQFYRDSVHYGGYKNRIMKDSTYRRHVDQAAKQALRTHNSMGYSFYKAYTEAAKMKDVLPIDVMLRMYEIGIYDSEALDEMESNNNEDYA